MQVRLHLFYYSFYATFVRLRLIVGLRFPALVSRFRSVSAIPLQQFNRFGGLPVCQRLREKPVPGGEALAPQPSSASQAPAGNTLEGIAAQCSAMAVMPAFTVREKNYPARPVCSRKYLSLQSLRCHKMELICYFGSRQPSFHRLPFF